MSDTVRIVSLNAEIWEIYREIRLKGLLEDPQAFGRSYEEEIVFQKEKWLQRASNPYGFIAIEENVPIGTMSAHITEESGERVAYVVGVFVAKESRGKKLGSKLLTAVIEKIKSDPSVKTLKLSVNMDQIVAVNLYKKFGFQIIGTEIHRMGDGIYHTEYIMQLLLEDTCSE